MVTEIDGNLALVIARHQEAIVEVACVESAGIIVAGIEEAGVTRVIAAGIGVTR